MWGFKISGNVLNSVYESVGDGVCINEVIYNDNGHHVDYRIIDANSAYESITGFKREEIAGQRASVVYNTKNPPHLNIYARVAETGEKANFETYTPQLRKHFNVSVISPEKGKFITILTDITNNSEIDGELEKVYENVPVVLMLVDSDRRILKLNKNAELFAGKSSEELVGSRGGDALGCLHSLDDPEGCGFGPHCKDCIVKNTVLDTFETGNNHYNI
ncbi:PAS domain-containing protein [Methanohalobium sp.]|uniref:PAS domain-containing protein n=1 Tax=Methanohalobium sp. TaxID=2837493 RepID=UPI0025E1F3E4|nr:PAS domain-containing protein [Methanohalobium sp.]